jgi:hypothetical protein
VEETGCRRWIGFGLFAIVLVGAIVIGLGPGGRSLPDALLWLLTSRA